MACRCSFFCLCPVWSGWSQADRRTLARPTRLNHPWLPSPPVPCLFFQVPFLSSRATDLISTRTRADIGDQPQVARHVTSHNRRRRLPTAPRSRVSNSPSNRIDAGINPGSRWLLQAHTHVRLTAMLLQSMTSFVQRLERGSRRDDEEEEPKPWEARACPYVRMYLGTCILTRHACTNGLPPTQRPSNIHSRDGAEYTPLYYLQAGKLLSSCINPRLTGICRHTRWHGTFEMIVARRNTHLFWWSRGRMSRCPWEETPTLHAAFKNSDRHSPSPQHCCNSPVTMRRAHAGAYCKTENLSSGESKSREAEKNRHIAERSTARSRSCVMMLVMVTVTVMSALFFGLLCPCESRRSILSLELGAHLCVYLFPTQYQASRNEHSLVSRLSFANHPSFPPTLQTLINTFNIHTPPNMPDMRGWSPLPVVLYGKDIKIARGVQTYLMPSVEGVYYPLY